jgi:hypothetical protein
MLWEAPIYDDYLNSNDDAKPFLCGHLGLMITSTLCGHLGLMITSTP